MDFNFGVKRYVFGGCRSNVKEDEKKASAVTPADEVAEGPNEKKKGIKKGKNPLKAQAGTRWSDTKRRKKRKKKLRKRKQNN